MGWFIVLLGFRGRFACGIDSYEKLGESKFRVSFVALKDREVIVEKIEGSFRAIIAINWQTERSRKGLRGFQ